MRHEAWFTWDGQDEIFSIKDAEEGLYPRSRIYATEISREAIASAKEAYHDDDGDFHLAVVEDDGLGEEWIEGFGRDSLFEHAVDDDREFGGGDIDGGCAGFELGRHGDGWENDQSSNEEKTCHGWMP